MIGVGRLSILRLASAPPVNTAAPSLSGSAGYTGSSYLYVSNGSWLGPVTSYIYSWYKNGSLISGETNFYYLMRQGDIGASITSGVIARNGQLNSTISTSSGLTVFFVFTEIPMIDFNWSSGSFYYNAFGESYSTLEEAGGIYTGPPASISGALVCNATGQSGYSDLQRNSTNFIFAVRLNADTGSTQERSAFLHLGISGEQTQIFADNSGVLKVRYVDRYSRILTFEGPLSTQVVAVSVSNGAVLVSFDYGPCQSGYTGDNANSMINSFRYGNSGSSSPWRGQVYRMRCWNRYGGAIYTAAEVQAAGRP